MWRKTEIPQGVKSKSSRKIVQLRYQDSEGKISTRGRFYWDERENAWVECTGYDFALYASDGWKVLAWFDEGKKPSRCSRKSATRSK